jgi:hypothetical protein
MNKGEPGIPGGGPFDPLLDDIYHTTPLVLSGQFAGDYLHRDAVIRLVTRHAQRHTVNHVANQNAQVANQNAQSVKLLTDLLNELQGAACAMDSDKMYSSLVTKKFLAAIQNINNPVTAN